MALNSVNILNKLVSHTKKVGGFKTVLAHEPKNAPPWGTAAIWLSEVVVDPSRSGLNRTNACIIWNIRIYTNMLSEPQDDIDLWLLECIDRLLTSFVADFTLEGAVKSIDLRGMNGTPLGLKTGHLEIDRKMFRVMDITLPVLVNNVWTEGN